MPNTIRTLPTEVINQIAAGEVVERPSNLIKELIENSLDAGSSKIEIHFSEGGRYVQIKDNGSGIKSSDLYMALSPHSTSKINSLQDIWNIHSYGFRGEALASIAEVSDLTLLSKPAEQKQASRLKSEFGKKTDIEQVGSEKGTTVIVKDLFQNTPARLKFLKSESSESSVIKNTIKAMALSHPSVEFRVLYKKKLLFYWPVAKNLKQRAESILALEKALYTKTKYQDINIEAVFCSPNETSPNKKQMWYFVENRWVDDSTIYVAIMSAYRSLLMHGEYPIVVLNLSCRKEDVDVNVHPAKSKVRFKNNSLIFKAVQHSLRSVLEGAPWINNKSYSTPSKEQELLFQNKEFQQTNLQKKTFQPFRYKEQPLDNTQNQEVDSRGDSLISSIKDLNINPSSLKPGVNKNHHLSHTHKVPDENELENEIEHTQKNYWSSLHILSQAYLTYIIAQNRTNIIFIDQHAAHERVLYEKLMSYWNTGKGEVQKRLIPLVLDIDASLVKSILSFQKEFLKIGLEIEASGPDGIIIYSAPAILKDVALQKALLQLADEVKSIGGSFAMENKISDLCATMACHSAIRAGKSLSEVEMKNLLISMDEFPLSSFCPHGRPVFVNYSLSKLEKDFGRRI